MIRSENTLREHYEWLCSQITSGRDGHEGSEEIERLDRSDCAPRCEDCWDFNSDDRCRACGAYEGSDRYSYSDSPAMQRLLSSDPSRGPR